MSASPFTISPCRVNEAGDVERVPEGEAEFWSVYRRNAQGLDMWISDHPNAAEAGTQMPDVDRLARKFVADMRHYLGGEKMAEIAKLNREEPDKGICHTHDYVDANVFMLEAFEGVVGREYLTGELGNPADDALFNDAWTKAKDMIQERFPAS